MHIHRYTARIGSVSIAEDVSYGELANRALEYIVRAAIAKAADDEDWEQAELRRGGLQTIEFLHDGKALWCHLETFEVESGEAEREGASEQFSAANECDAGFLKRLDRDLREKLKRAGFNAPSLITNMKALFMHVGSEASERTITARETLVGEILAS